MNFKITCLKCKKSITISADKKDKITEQEPIELDNGYGWGSGHDLIIECTCGNKVDLSGPQD